MSELPFKLLGFDHLLLLVRDMDATERFYCDVLGCSVTHRLPQYGMTEVSAGSSTLVFVDTTDRNGAWALEGAGQGRNVDHFAIATDHWDESAMRAHLARYEIKIEEERTEEDSLSFYIRDPSGKMVELLRRNA